MNTLLPVLSVLGRVLMGFSLAFCVPMAWAWFLDAHHYFQVWLFGFIATLALGYLLWVLTKKYRRELIAKDGFLLVNLVWSVLTVVCAIPMLYIVPNITWSQAFFESMSAITATGATALTGLDDLPVSVNVWRCFLQLIGGLGIMLLVVAILPMLGLGSMQVYKAETPGPMKDARFTPRIAETARGLWGVYFVFSVLCFLAYRFAGMTWADAFMHMCSTMGLGGLSSHDASYNFWDSALIEAIATFFMALAGISFVRYFMVLKTRDLKPLLQDTEVRAYCLALLASIAAITAVLLWHGTYDSFWQALRMSSFHVLSVATTTGYSSTDYSLWPSFTGVLLLFLGCVISCAGSTGGGIKMVRMVLLVKQARRELVRIIHPRVVNPVTLGGNIVSTPVMTAVFGFMLIYGATTVILTMLLLLSGLDVVTAFTAIVATLNNIGPGLGPVVGPAGNYTSFDAFQLGVCSLAMLMGRLELLSVLVIFTGHFWRK